MFYRNVVDIQIPFYVLMFDVSKPWPTPNQKVILDFSLVSTDHDIACWKLKEAEKLSRKMKSLELFFNQWGGPRLS